MRVPHLLMAAASVAVLGLAVYLFLEVKKAPAAPSAIAAAAPHEVPPTDVPPPVKVPDSPPETKRDRHDPSPVTSEPSPPPPPTVTAARPMNDDAPKVDVNQDAMMDEANKAYDKQDFDEARAAAGRVLAQQPNNTRMLRIMVSAACIEVDATEAQKWFPRLSPDDQKAMRTRCTRYGVTFPDAK